MEISITDAQGQLADLVRRAEQGDDIVLTRRGQPIVRLVPLSVAPDRAARRRILEAARHAVVAKAITGVSAAESQDFPYDEVGLPK